MNERREKTASELLKDAAIKLIRERGFSGATLAPILQEAGLSKGAMFHHYDSRDALMADAYTQLLDNTMRADRRSAHRLRTGEITLGDFLRKKVDSYRSEMFVVTMELAVAVRARPRILEAAEGFPEWQAFQTSYWQETFELPGRDDEQIRTHWEMLGYTLRGIGLRQMFGTGEKDSRRLAEALMMEFFSEAAVRPLDHV